MMQSRSTPKQMVAEPARQTPVVEQVDVLVAGGGPAGVAAALAAARAGASVRLVEAHGQLGGIWTSGLLSWILDSRGKPGIMAEILERLERGDGLGSKRYAAGTGVAADVEKMKRVLEQMCVEAGVRVRYHSRIAAAAADAGGRLAYAITESKSGREAWAAKVFVDCTGDGDLAAFAGCRFDFGRPAEGPGAEGPDRAGESQPFSMICLVGGMDPTRTAEFFDRHGRPWNAPKDALMAEFRRFGRESSYGKPTVFHVRDDLYIWMVNHEYGYSALSADDVSEATFRSREELHELIDGLRSLGGCWENVRLIATAEQIGTREGRRIRGRYTVTTDDLLHGARFDDAVCRVSFGIDVHSTSRRHGTVVEQAPGRTQPYDIPLRSLIAADCDGLLMAGRCISGDFIAHSSYRVTGNAVAMGQAAGACAAVAAGSGCQPHEVPFDELAAHLPAANLEPTKK